MDLLNRNFDEIWFVDFEFCAPAGERPEVICMVAREYFSGRLIRLTQAELTALRSPPFPTDEKSLIVAYYSTAEWCCFLKLGISSCRLRITRS